MQLIKLTLRNFMGIKDFTLDAQGGNVSIFGDNATGKTTLYSAFNWLLFDKDSQNKKDFQIKTLDKTGEVIHGLSHEVEGVFEINAKSVTLKKAYAEKWTKKRGSAKAEFTGHTTEYFINSVPSQKKEYDTFIIGIADESIFKLLTSPTFFNEQLHWQKRRETLLEVCGDISDEAVIASDKKLAKLPAILQGRALEDHRKIIAAKRAEINKELEKIPVRIDETNRSLPAESGVDAVTAKDNIDFLKYDLQKKQAELARVEGGGEIAEKRRQLAEAEGDLLRLQNEQRTDIAESIDIARGKNGELKNQIASMQSEISFRVNKINQHDKIIANYEVEAEILRKKWHEANNEQFEINQESVCPACGQDLPEEQLTEARDKALAAFNLDKAQRLENITSKGKQTKTDSEALQIENMSLQNSIDDAQKHIDELEKESASIVIMVDGLMQACRAAADNPTNTQKLKEKQNIEKAISQLQFGTSEAAETAKKEIADLSIAIIGAEGALAQIKQREAGLVRITELLEQEKTLAAEFERLEGELYLTEQFIRAKVALLEDKINSRFKYARFKMFDTQINGGITECCETLFQGVPYSSGLNNAARINVGLDIINTLAEHYSFNAPIFIDNREAVTRVIETTGQLISLIVSEPDKTMRVEKEETNGR